MTLLRFDRPFGGAFSEIDRIRTEIDRVLSGERASGRSSDSSGVFPPINVFEDKDRYVLTAELPGIGSDELEITVTEDSVALKGTRKADDGGKTASYHRRERGSGFFRRILSLPSKVNPQGAEASNRHGILHIALPKAENAKPRRIQVKGNE